MRKKRNPPRILADLLALVGVGLVAWSGYLIYPPLAPAWLGAAALTLAVLLAKTQGKKP